MKIYLSGPINGIPNGNRDRFRRYGDELFERGHEVISPHGLSHNHDGPCHGKETGRKGDPHRYGCYLLTALRALASCDAIQMLPDWEHSPGARVEYYYAIACGILIRYPLQEI